MAERNPDDEIIKGAEGMPDAIDPNADQPEQEELQGGGTDDEHERQGQRDVEDNVEAEIEDRLQAHGEDRL
jgi:hypothetical protein